MPSSFKLQYRCKNIHGKGKVRKSCRTFPGVLAAHACSRILMSSQLSVDFKDAAFLGETLEYSCDVAAVIWFKQTAP